MEGDLDADDDALPPIDSPYFTADETAGRPHRARTPLAKLLPIPCANLIGNHPLLGMGDGAASGLGGARVGLKIRSKIEALHARALTP